MQSPRCWDMRGCWRMRQVPADKAKEGPGTVDGAEWEAPRIRRRPPLPISVVVVTHRKPRVLPNTLKSYRAGGLLDAVSQIRVYGNDTTPEDEATCASIPVTFVPRGDDSVAKAQKQAASEATSEYILFLEDDFVLLSSPENARTVLEDSLAVLESEPGVQTVRLRHRERPGFPLHPAWFAGQEDESSHKKSVHLLNCVHWYDDPPANVRCIEECTTPGLAHQWYKTGHRFAVYTNNPCLYRRQWWIDYILPHNRGPAARNEDKMRRPWLTMDQFVVAQGPGLFCHWDFMRYEGHSMDAVRFLNVDKPVEAYLRDG